MLDRYTHRPPTKVATSPKVAPKVAKVAKVAAKKTHHLRATFGQSASGFSLVRGLPFGQVYDLRVGSVRLDRLNALLGTRLGHAYDQIDQARTELEHPS